MNKLDVNNTHNGRAFLGVVLAVLLLSVSSWAACYDNDWSNFYTSGCSISSCYECNSAPDARGGCSLTRDAFSPRCLNFNGNPNSNNVVIDCRTKESTFEYRQISCSSKCEADSVSCVYQGNVWNVDTSASCGKSCKINNCKAADSTWLSTSIAACMGSNNYALVNTDSTCEHVGACCDGLDSIPEGSTCKWRCDSVLTQCNGRAGALFGAVLPDTSVSGEDTTFSYQCFYNCAYSPNPDSTVYLVEGNTVLSGPSDSIADGIKSEWFSSIRSTTGSIYVYDYLSPAASEYVDSIATAKCVEHLWRCVINSKYVYWYDNQEVPAGCTNIVRVK